ASGDQGTDLRLRIKRVTKPEYGRALSETFDKLFVDRALYEHARAGATVLSAIAENGEDRGFYAPLQIRIRKHHIRRFTSKFKRYTRDIIGTQAHDLRTDLGRASKRNLRDQGVSDQCVAHCRPRSRKYREHAGWESCLHQDISQHQHREWCELGRLHYDRIPTCQGGRDFPGCDDEWEVPRRN